MTPRAAPGRRPLVVGLAGGSASGKSALARAIAAALAPRRVAVLAQDAYYRGLPPGADPARVSFDEPEALDGPRFAADLARLAAGLAVRPPRYCFVRHRRLGAGPLVPPGEVVLAEGLFVLHDPAVRDGLDLAIFVDCPEPVRLARRLARDTAERGRTPAAVVRQFRTSVQAAHLAHVEPSRARADLVLVNVGALPAIAEVAARVIVERLAAPPAAVRGAA
jgi:uridine kinase